MPNPTSQKIWFNEMHCVIMWCSAQGPYVTDYTWKRPKTTPQKTIKTNNYTSSANFRLYFQMGPVPPALALFLPPPQSDFSYFQLRFRNLPNGRWVEALQILCLLVAQQLFVVDFFGCPQEFPGWCKQTDVGSFLLHRSHQRDIKGKKQIMNNALVVALEAQNFKDWPLNLLV